MQASLHPRIAFMRLKPSIALQPEPGSRLLHGGGRVVEIEAARPLQKVAAGRSHVAQLRRGSGEDGARRAADSVW